MNTLRAAAAGRTDAGRRFELSRRASFWVSAAVVGNTLWTSAAPSVTYPLYAARWHLTPTVTTAMFAVYPITVVAVLLLFGNLSDFIGRRRAILLGLAAALLGALLFALAPSVAWVFAGRAFMGLGVGLVTSPATAAMVEFSAAGQTQRASSIATAATAVGLALATLLGGSLIQYAPFPMHLNFWVLFAVLAVLSGFAWLLPRQAPTTVTRRWRPATVGVPPALRSVFIAAMVAVTAAYAHGAIMLSLASQVARDLIGSPNALVNGAAIALFAVVTGLSALLGKRLPARTNVVLGGIGSIAGMGLLTAAVAQHSLVVFLLAAVGAGTGYGLMFSGGLGLVNANAPPDHRAATLSAIYLVAFLTMGAMAIAMGAVATSRGLGFAIDLGAPAIALLSLAALVLAARGTPLIVAPCPSPLTAKRS